MPPKMRTTFGKCFIAISGGTFEPVSVQDVQVIPDETLAPGEIAIDRLNADREITGTFTLRPHVRKRFMRAVYGWKARGPLHWRQVRKALRML